ncbi:chondroitin AC/alginate lyase [Armillaria mellea]|nr:chondroitin AC/alginate lyase [Armillaria mellea]
MANYNAVQNNGNHPYGAGDPYYNESTGFITPVSAAKKKTSNWIKFGIPVAVLVIVGAVVGGVVGSRSSKSSSSNDASSSSSTNSAAQASAASAAVTAKNDIGIYATATNSEFMVPLYPSTTNAAAFTTPTFVDTSSASNAWPKDSFSPSSPSVTSVRSDRPRLIAPAYKWQALPTLIANDPYLKSWNETIFGNATAYYSLDPVVYHMDGDSGILDNAREVKMRVKAFAYVYRMTNDTKWVDRCWEEIQNAAGNGSTSFGPTDDKWNTGHFLDTAEFSSAFAIAYDWLYDVWTDDQKTQMRYTLNLYGLGPGVAAYNDPTVYTGWWRTNTTGNWNCVCNAGLTMASLAILGDDTTTNAETLLGLTIDNALQNCAQAVTDDGTWAETANYWYFGTTGHAEMSSALLTATGSDYGLLDNNVDFKKTSDFHMYVFGPTSLFDWGDHGPNKFSSTANSIIWYGTYFDEPVYTLFQREQHDVPEPWSMFWYDPTVVGAFWDGKPLDSFFDNQLDQWVSMRSSWTDINALYVAMKAGKNQGHQTHNDLDVGDFVLDALGTRWAGELGSGDYLSTNYFSNDSQISDRWKYYRKMTEGQNTILIGKTNQDVLALPTILKSGTSNTTQGSSTVLEVDSDSTAFWVADTTSAYFNATSVKRGVRMLNKRKQVLVQDEVTSTADIQWRMHTNATVTTDGSKATLVRDGKTLEVSILSPSGATFTTSAATRFDTDPTPPDPDQANPNITVVIIELSAGTNNIQVLFNPQWNDGTTFVTPSSVDLDNWSLTSHN